MVNHRQLGNMLQRVEQVVLVMIQQGTRAAIKMARTMVPEELEAWVSRLEKIVAKLKAKRFGHTRPVHQND